MITSPALLSDDGLYDAIAETEARAREVHARRLALLSEFVARGLDVADYRQITRADPGEVKRWTLQARWFLPTQSPTGQPVAPLYPTTAAVVTELSEGHLREIARALDRQLPDGSEEILVQAALSVEPRAVRHLADRIHLQAVADAADEVDEPAADPGDLLWLRDLPGGRVEFSGELSVESGAQLRAVLEPLSQPRADDPRDLAHRQGEAFADLVALAMRSGGLPSEAGERPHISITLDYGTLRRGTGHAVLDGGRYLSAAQARRIACDAKTIPAVLGDRSEVLDLGRARRTVSLAQRRALHTRDRGCAFPGCPRPPKWCDAHHIRHWADGGSTDLDNLVLLCRHHHSLVHHSHWRITLSGGVPAFIPPRHIDPAQQPRQNLLHRQPTDPATTHADAA
ncbi:DUF222 domain-containing protein [Actinosynnema sp. CS-041913]|uniref:HNH endonuclease signature motif containing protein n=1 Tax=Actinosynnema sp. CS-041913 TaxID=3239917 RepID=UPI003D8D5293